jgi:hypothetical protein
MESVTSLHCLTKALRRSAERNSASTGAPDGAKSATTNSECGGGGPPWVKITNTRWRPTQRGAYFLLAPKAKNKRTDILATAGRRIWIPSLPFCLPTYLSYYAETFCWQHTSWVATTAGERGALSVLNQLRAVSYDSANVILESERVMGIPCMLIRTFHLTKHWTDLSAKVRCLGHLLSVPPWRRTVISWPQLAWINCC